MVKPIESSSRAPTLGLRVYGIFGIALGVFLLSSLVSSHPPNRAGVINGVLILTLGIGTFFLVRWASVIFAVVLFSFWSYVIYSSTYLYDLLDHFLLIAITGLFTLLPAVLVWRCWTSLR